MIKHDVRELVFARDFYVCQKCGNNENLGIAHRIKQGHGTINYIKKFVMKKYNLTLKKYQILEIINDPLNLVVACNGACNDSFNIFNKPVQRDELIIKILYKLGFCNG